MLGLLVGDDRYNTFFSSLLISFFCIKIVIFNINYVTIKNSYINYTDYCTNPLKLFKDLATRDLSILYKIQISILCLWGKKIMLDVSDPLPFFVQSPLFLHQLSSHLALQLSHKPLKLFFFHLNWIQPKVKQPNGNKTQNEN